MLPKFSKKALILSLLSILIVLYAEWIYPSKAFRQCKWPLRDHAKHVAIISDPQIIDNYSYPGRMGILRSITEKVTDRFMARNFRLLHRRLKPDAIVFLGDLMDGGRNWEDDAWELEFQRYRRIFPISPSVVQMENLPGNHDIGCMKDIIPHSYERFEEHFGSANQVYSLGGVSLVTLDTNALMDTARPSIHGPARELLNNISSHRDKYGPIILFSHIPLHRPENSPCGFERESSKSLSWVYGHQYITEVDVALSNEILEKLKPTYIFSGDDHDYCKFTHEFGDNEHSEEITLKSFSMAMSVKKPGFQLLSLDFITHEQQTDSCLVADPFAPFIIQGIAFPLLLLLSTVNTYYAMKRKSRLLYLPVSSKERGSEDTRNIKNRSLIMNDSINTVTVLTFTWIIAQVMIHCWSYSGNI